MEEPRALRRLAAILAADVVGYSRLIGQDEAGTLAALRAHRRGLIDGLVATHEGRIFKLTGDGILVEFPSVVNAVACAVAVQRGMALRNADVPDERRIVLRIGVHLGDIIAEGDDILGDGVNVAARIEALARPGGVCVSGVVRDNVGNRLDLAWHDRGEQALKNIDRPVRLHDVAPDTAAHTATELRDRRTIAVLPFANMSGDPEQEYFSDGITEDIITNLSKISALGVTARNTSFQFKGRAVDVPQIARQLKVSHVLEGSVRKAGGRVRITAQLIDGATGEHLWAERYDRDLSDIFALQDEISETIVAVLKLKLLPAEKASIEARSTTNPQTYNLYLMARHYSVVGSQRHRAIIVRICRRAVELDPGYAPAWALMSIALGKGHMAGEQPAETPLDMATRAVALDPNLADAHAALGRYLVGEGQYDEAIRVLNRALRLDPNSYEAHAAAARCAIAQGRNNDALNHLEMAASLQPDDFWACGMAMAVCDSLGDMEGARSAARRTLDRIAPVIAAEPDHGNALGFGAGALFLLDEVQRAEEWIERALLLDPDNDNMRHNVACALTGAGLYDRAVEMLEPLFPQMRPEGLRWVKLDPDLDPLRDIPRFRALIARTEARLAGGEVAVP